MKHMKHISDPKHTINKRIHRLYPEEIAQKAVNDMIDLIFKYKQRIDSKPYHLSEFEQYVKEDNQ